VIYRSTHVKYHVTRHPVKRRLVKHLGLVVIAAGLAAGAATPSFAQVPPQAPAGVVQTPQRDQAIHDCSTEASKWSFSTWQTTQIITYDDCMANHGQPE
jgi:hypothetical protein